MTVIKAIAIGGIMIVAVIAASVWPGAKSRQPASRRFLAVSVFVGGLVALGAIICAILVFKSLGAGNP
jgi:hypothetical protein